jgi:hypothetical protein
MKVEYESDGYGRIDNLTPAQVDKLIAYSALVRGLKFHNFEEEVGSKLRDPESITLHFYCRNKSARWKRVFADQLVHILKD